MKWIAELQNKHQKSDVTSNVPWWLLPEVLNIPQKICVCGDFPRTFPRFKEKISIFLPFSRGNFSLFFLVFLTEIGAAFRMWD